MSEVTLYTLLPGRISSETATFVSGYGGIRYSLQVLKVSPPHGVRFSTASAPETRLDTVKKIARFFDSFSETGGAALQGSGLRRQ